jgi:hypothetical protein
MVSFFKFSAKKHHHPTHGSYPAGDFRHNKKRGGRQRQDTLPSPVGNIKE